MAADNHISERDGLTQKIIEEAPRLKLDDKFSFACHSDVPCFNLCCRNVNIVLTPYDVLRMSRHLKMSTTDFLAKYTFVPFSEDSRLPIVFLKMEENQEKTCHFVTKEGCSIYPARPWPCRMYPIGQASPAEGEGEEDFFFLVKETHCLGHKEKKTWTVREWIDDQAAAEYDKMGEGFKGVLLHPYLKQKELDPARMEMFYMASYDLDKFRRFVFESKFLKRFLLEPDYIAKLKNDDLELMSFAFRWLRFALFGELTLELNKEMLSARELEALSKRT